MEHHLQLNRILLLLMGTICGTQAARVENLFKKLDPGQNITGRVGRQFAIELEECSAW